MEFMDPRLEKEIPPYDPVIFDIMGVSAETYQSMKKLSEEFPRFGDFFTARFLTTQFSDEDFELIQLLASEPNHKDDWYSQKSGRDIRETRKVIHRLTNFGIVRSIFDNRVPRYWEIEPKLEFNTEVLYRNVLKERDTLFDELHTEYSSLSGEFYQCESCQTLIRFDDLIGNAGACYCGSRKLSTISEHPKRELIRRAVGEFYGSEGLSRLEE